MTALLLGNFAASTFLCGLIWTIQLVHYPLFDAVGRDGFAAYEARHTASIGPLVAPAMLLEAALTLALLRPSSLPTWAVWLNAVLLGVIWLSTALLQVPQHAALSGGFAESAHRMLVNSNWIRTAAWTLKALLLGGLLWLELK